MVSVAVIDYNAGNIRSVAKALEVVNADTFVASSPKDLERAEKIVLPGVGFFGDGMKNLERLGLVKALEKEVLGEKKPFLGICLGMQLLSLESEESSGVKGLGWLNTKVTKLHITEPGIKIPHMGWNELDLREKATLFRGLPKKPCFYFAHSYAMNCLGEPNVVRATANYGGNFVVAVEKGNIFGVQFHPEKSQEPGLKLLKNFVKWGPGND